MKKQFFLSSLLIIGTVLMANAQLSFRAGLNLSNLKYEVDGENVLESQKNLPGLQFGAAFNASLAGGLSIEPGLLFTMKGVKFENDLVKGSANLTYIQIPAIIKYNIGAGPIKVFVGIGPALNVGLIGRQKVQEDISAGGLKYSEDIKFSKDIDQDPDLQHVKPMDLGLKSTLGVKLKSFIIALEYELGLTNIEVYEEDIVVMKNRSASVVIAYALRK